MDFRIDKQAHALGGGWIGAQAAALVFLSSVEHLGSIRGGIAAALFGTVAALAVGLAIEEVQKALNRRAILRGQPVEHSVERDDALATAGGGAIGATVMVALLMLIYVG